MKTIRKIILCVIVLTTVSLFPLTLVAADTIMCSCGSMMLEEIIDMGYSCPDESGHVHDFCWVYTCPNCGDQRFYGAPGEGTWETHTLRNGACVQCGYHSNVSQSAAAQYNNSQSSTTNRGTRSFTPAYDCYDMGIPDLRGHSYGMDQMNLTIYWVQVQMKATGIYYQGQIWDETGNLGDHTMQEIASFMQGRGYYNHDGHIDQNVVDELVAYLGNRLVPVYIGGFYSHMDSIMVKLRIFDPRVRSLFSVIADLSHDKLCLSRGEQPPEIRKEGNRIFDEKKIKMSAMLIIFNRRK